MDLPYVLIKLKNGIQLTALKICEEKIQPQFKKIAENSQFEIYGDFYSNTVSIKEVPLYAVER